MLLYSFVLRRYDYVCAVLLLSSVLSISLIEPGPVITEFERKVYDEGLKTDLSKADPVTADIFLNIYLKNYKQIFETLGQTAEDVAEVQCCSSTKQNTTNLLSSCLLRSVSEHSCLLCVCHL